MDKYAYGNPEIQVWQLTNLTGQFDRPSEVESLRWVRPWRSGWVAVRWAGYARTRCSKEAPPRHSNSHPAPSNNVRDLWSCRCQGSTLTFSRQSSWNYPIRSFVFPPRFTNHIRHTHKSHSGTWRVCTIVLVSMYVVHFHDVWRERPVVTGGQQAVVRNLWGTSLEVLLPWVWETIVQVKEETTLRAPNLLCRFNHR